MQIPRLFVMAAVMLFWISVAHAEGAADLLRSLTGALKGGRSETQQEKSPTAVMGVRGIDDVDNKKHAATASGADNDLMEGWAATGRAASHAAEKKGLAARRVTLKN